MVVESYSNDRLVKKVETRLRPAGNQRFQGVDTYVDPEEDLVKVTLKCRPVSSAGINEFVFFIVPDE